jgi:hypothetical protein
MVTPRLGEGAVVASFVGVEVLGASFPRYRSLISFVPYPQPAPGKRLCSRCGELKELEAFAIKTTHRRARLDMRALLSLIPARALPECGAKRAAETLLRFVVCEADHLEAD